MHSLPPGIVAKVWSDFQIHKEDFNLRKDVVGWVTQLVVLKKYRRRKIATTLLRCLTMDKWYSGLTILGIASSQPASCTALASLAGQQILVKFTTCLNEISLRNTGGEY